MKKRFLLILHFLFLIIYFLIDLEISNYEKYKNPRQLSFIQKIIKKDDTESKKINFSLITIKKAKKNSVDWREFILYKKKFLTLQEYFDENLLSIGRKKERINLDPKFIFFDSKNIHSSELLISHIEMDLNKIEKKCENNINNITKKCRNYFLKKALLKDNLNQMEVLFKIFINSLNLK